MRIRIRQGNGCREASVFDLRDESADRRAPLRVHAPGELQGEGPALMRKSALIISTLAAGVITAGALTATPAMAAYFAATVGVAPAAWAPPPPLPAEVQPPIPGYGYIWTPGYWGWGIASGYYWIPGVWVQPPAVGLLWTPPWWGYVGGVYVFNAGYWGFTVGFYGGIDYGWGYGGFGYDGGYWRGRTFYYNTVVNNLGGRRINTVFTRPVSVNRAAGRISFNGGRGGVALQASHGQLAALHDRRLPATRAQVAHLRTASLNSRSHVLATRAVGAAVTRHAASASFHHPGVRMAEHHAHYALRGSYAHAHAYAGAAHQRAFHGGPSRGYFEVQRGGGFHGGGSERGRRG
jgi:hypothetical protein